MSNATFPTLYWSTIFVMAFLPFMVFTEEAPFINVNFKDLEVRDDLEDQHIQIKGFVYKREDGKQVLAGEPGLKSCCVGSFQNQKKQLLILADLDAPASHFPVTLQGILKRNFPQKDPTEAQPNYRLENPRILIQGERSPQAMWLYLTLGTAAILGVSFFLLRKKG